MNFDAFIKTTRSQPSTSRNPIVEGVCRNVTVDGVYFTVPSWDDGRHVFGPTPWSGTVAPGDKVLVAFPGDGVDDAWILASR